MNHWSNLASINLRAENLQINQSTTSLKLHSVQLFLEHLNKRLQQLRLRFKLIYSWKTLIGHLLKWWCLNNLTLKWWANSNKHLLNKLWCITNSSRQIQAWCIRCSKHLITQAWWVKCNKPLKTLVWCNRDLLILSNKECLPRFSLANKCSQEWWDNQWCRGQIWCRDQWCLSNKWCNNKCISSKWCSSSRCLSNSHLLCKCNKCLISNWCLNNNNRCKGALLLLSGNSKCHLLRLIILISRRLLHQMIMAKHHQLQLTLTVTMYLIVQISKININICNKTNFNTRSRWDSIKLMIKNSRWCMAMLINNKWWWCLQWTTRCQGQLALLVKWRLELSSITTLQCLLQLCSLRWITLYLLFNLFHLEMQEDSSSSLKTATTCRIPNNSTAKTLTKWCIKIQTMPIKTLIWCNSSNMLSNSRWCKCSNMIPILKASMIQLRHLSWNKWQSMKKIDSQHNICLKPI